MLYKSSSTCFGQYFAHHQERETEIFTAYGILLLWWVGRRWATAHRLPTHHNKRIPYVVNISVSHSWLWAKYCQKHVELFLEIIKSLLHLVGSSILLYLIDDARTNKNQIQLRVVMSADLTGQAHGPHHVWGRREQYLQEADVSVNWFTGADTVQCMGTSLQSAHGVYTEHIACICTFLHFMKGLLILGACTQFENKIIIFINFAIRKEQIGSSCTNVQGSFIFEDFWKNSSRKFKILLQY